MAEISKMGTYKVTSIFQEIDHVYVMVQVQTRADAADLEAIRAPRSAT
jgi:hypothetical protein